jgi:hypothetical protein
LDRERRRRHESIGFRLSFGLRITP